MGFLQENIGVILTGVTGAIGSVAGFFTGRKQKASKDKEAESNALQQMQKAYDAFSVDMKEKYTELKTELREIKDENKTQRADLRGLQKDNSKLHLEVAQLTRENHELKQMVAELKSENSTLQNELKKYRKK